MVGGFYTAAAWRQPSSQAPQMSQSFSVMLALGFAAMLAVMLVGVSALRALFGQPGIISAAAIAGVLDVHAAAIAVALQVADGRLSADQAVLPVLVACSTSTGAKILFSTAAGTRQFSARVIPGLVLIAAAAWAGWWAICTLA